MKTYIGVDIGTTCTKALLYDENGQVLHSASFGYPLYSPTPAVAEQNPEEIFTAVVKTLKSVISLEKYDVSTLQFVSFSAAMHSVIAIDEKGQPLTNSITWADSRATKFAEKIKSDWNGKKIYMRTGTPIHPMSPLAKITWLRHEKEEIFNATAKFIGIKEYVFHKLFGRYIVDHSIASATGLFNLTTNDWDEEALAVAGITTTQLSELVPTTTVVTDMLPAMYEKIGFPADVRFIIGANDGVLSNLGVNAIDPGVVAVTIGTSGAIRTVSDKPVTDPKGRIFCYVLTDKHWVIGGPVNNGGMTFRWVRDELAASEVETAKRLGIDSYEILTKIAERVAPGAEGLLFHPYLAGERAPLWNANARGSFFGLGLHHKREHMIRAVLEGVIFNLYTVLLALEELIGIPQKIQATGGFAKSALWRQMMADIFNQTVTVPESHESSCLGAVVLGLYATGEIEDFSIVSKWVGGTHHHEPIPENTKIYNELTPIFIRLSRMFNEEYESIVEFQNKWVKK
ncbi:MAG: gluconokinase [Kurthia sp.]|nr:gluconokinase [Candidatus Kurthia equi]